MENERRTQRRQIILTVAAVSTLASLVIVGLYVSDKPRRIQQAAKTVPEVVSQYRLPAKSVEPSDIWITRSEGDLRALKQHNEALERKLEVMNKTLEALQKKTITPIRNEPLSLSSPLPTTPKGMSVQPGSPIAPLAENILPPPPFTPARGGASLPGKPGAQANALSGILVVDVTNAAAKIGVSKDGSKSAKERHTIRSFIPAGTFATATLLAGIDAPTGGAAKTNPQPVLLRLTDQGTLPNRFRSRVRSCFVTAAGFGDISAERANLRLEKLSCVMRDETVLEMPIKGYVTGEDGKAGMRGRIVSKQGQMIAQALVAGVAGGIGKGISQSYTSLSTNPLGAVSTVDPSKIADYGVAQGFSGTLDKIAQWYLERANETYPIVEVDAGRTVEVVLSEGLDLGMDIFEKASDL